jgi:oxaloacetate decarboxylase beta subunit
MDFFLEFVKTTGFYLMTPGNFMMIVIGLVFIALAIIKHYEPLLLLPIGFGMIVGNIPSLASMPLGVYDAGRVFFITYISGLRRGYSPL